MSSLLPSTPAGASAGAELVTSDGRSLALVSAQLRGEAQGGIARLVLEQRFANTYDENLRVTYRMPLPADGAISGYEFEIGERVIKGVVDRKQAAREKFERAIVEGKTAALLEQERADIFTQQIGNIPPRESVLARITVDQRLVWLPEGEWELRFPTVIGPRYIGSADTAADVRATHIKVTDKPLAATVQIAIAIRDTIVAGAKPSSPSHMLEHRTDGFTELKAGSRLDRDIVVRWPVTTPTPGLSLATARPAGGSDAFALLTIVPPARDAKPVAVPRDLIVLLDTSGSMSGGPLDKAKQVVAMMLDSLDAEDRFELIEFSNSPRRYHDEPLVATASAKQTAIRWVRSRVADGGTEMRQAVIEAMATLRVGAQRQVVVVTDGYVGGEHQILEALSRRLPKSCRVHVLGVGSAVNRSLATALARAGRGTEVIVGIDEDAERGAKRLLDRTRAPIVTNVEIMGSALLRHAPERIPDVFEGAPLVAALAVRPEGGELVVRGQLARESWEQRIQVPALRDGVGNQAIAALYGRERVADVEANALFGSVDGEIEDLGLTFQIATRMTSWVAVDEVRRVTGPTRDQLIPQELPYGTTASAFGLRGSNSGMAMTRTGAFAMDSLEDVADAFVPAPAAYSRAPRSVSAVPPGPASVRAPGGRLPTPPAPSYSARYVEKDAKLDIDDDADFGEEAPAEPQWEEPTGEFYTGSAAPAESRDELLRVTAKSMAAIAPEPEEVEELEERSANLAGPATPRAKSTTESGAPPAPARSRRSEAPPAAPPAPPKPRPTAAPDAAPPAQAAPSSTLELRSPAKEAGEREADEPAAQAPADKPRPMVARKGGYPTQAGGVPEQPVGGRPSTGMQTRAPSRLPEELQQEHEARMAPAAKKRSPSIFALLALVLALVAVLIWWLTR